MKAARTLEQLLDQAALIDRREEKRRDYLGASRWGEPCVRRLAYEWHKVSTDNPDPMPARVVRIADMGHDAEIRVADYLRQCGLGVWTSSPRRNGEQWGFTAADGRLAGHCDGIIPAFHKTTLGHNTNDPVFVTLHKLLREYLDEQLPLVWENKVMSDSIWRDVRRNGVAASKPVYWGQAQTYIAYLSDDIEKEFGSPLKGALFTALNRDTGEILVELIKPDLEAAQILSDRALRVVDSETPEEMPRLAKDPSDWRCGMCPYRVRCHDLKPAKLVPVSKPPQWLAPKDEPKPVAKKRQSKRAARQ